MEFREVTNKLCICLHYEMEILTVNRSMLRNCSIFDVAPPIANTVTTTTAIVAALTSYKYIGSFLITPPTCEDYNMLTCLY